MIVKPVRLTCVSLLCFLSLFASPYLSAQAGSDDAAAQLAEEGQKALSNGQYREAQTNFEKLAALEPHVAEVHATLAVIDFTLRQYDQAVQEIRTAQKLKPGLPKLTSLLGISLAELGQFSDALPLLQKAFQQTADPEVQRMAGLQLLRVYTGLHRDPEAVQTALALNKSFPDDPEILYNTARIYGNYTYQVMEKLHDKAPDSVWMLQAQGEAYESQKDYEAAIAAFNHVLVLDPRRPGVHYRMGRVYLTRYQGTHEDKDRDLAQEQFRAELASDPQNGNAAYELAQIDYDQGNLDQARQQFEALLQSRPNFEEAQVGLAGVLLESHNEAQAIPHLKQAIQLDPNDEVAWYRLARALRVTGDAAGETKAMAEFHRLHAVELAHTAPAGTPLTNGEVTPQHLGDSAQP